MTGTDDDCEASMADTDIITTELFGQFVVALSRGLLFPDSSFLTKKFKKKRSLGKHSFRFFTFLQICSILSLNGPITLSNTSVPFNNYVMWID